MQTLITRLGLEGRLRRENLVRYGIQSGLATAFLLALLLIMDVLTQNVLIAALGASTFIAFVVPRSITADSRHLIGGYLMGIIAGAPVGWLAHQVHTNSLAAYVDVVAVFGALATGLAMFLMVATKTEHPPAAALALGLVLNEWDWFTLALVVGGVTVLALFKQFIRPYLTDLL
jgi:CBS-domain-containing membrane protein